MKEAGWIGLQAGEGVGGAVGTTACPEPSGCLSAGLPSQGPANGEERDSCLLCRLETRLLVKTRNALLPSSPGRKCWGTVGQSSPSLWHMPVRKTLVSGSAVILLSSFLKTQREGLGREQTCTGWMPNGGSNLGQGQGPLILL